mgnify:FL=1
MLPKKISPVWLIISIAFGLIISLKDTLDTSLVAIGMAFSVFGAYFIGRAEENYLLTKENKTIYDSFKHPMYLGTSLFLLGIAVAMESIVLGAITLVWTIGALYLAWKESHSSSNS